MKITVSKELTTLAQLDKVKEDCKQFKACYTANDLLNAWNERCRDRDLWTEHICGDVISVDITAFPAKLWTDCDTSFGIELVVDGINEFHKLRYYADLGLQIDDRPEVIAHKVYREVKE